MIELTWWQLALIVMGSASLGLVVTALCVAAKDDPQG